MPPRRPPRRRPAVLQCVYREGSRRCQRNGFGNPPLCHSHRIAVAETAAQQRSPLGKTAELLDDLLTGRKPRRGAVSGVLDELFEFVGRGATPRTSARPQGDDFPWIFDNPPMPGARARPRQPPPPPPDPELVAKAKARKVLGFGKDEPLTAAQVKSRKRELAMKFHPDRPGGSTEKMAAVNAAADLLLESLS